MKVYALLESNWQDFEGGGDNVLDIFSNIEIAEQDFKKNWRKLKGRSWPKDKPIALGYEFEAVGSPSRSGLRIEEFEVIEK